MCNMNLGLATCYSFNDSCGLTESVNQPVHAQCLSEKNYWGHTELTFKYETDLDNNLCLKLIFQHGIDDKH